MYFVKKFREYKYKKLDSFSYNIIEIVIKYCWF